MPLYLAFRARLCIWSIYGFYIGIKTNEELKYTDLLIYLTEPEYPLLQSLVPSNKPASPSSSHPTSLHPIHLLPN